MALSSKSLSFSPSPQLQNPTLLPSAKPQPQLSFTLSHTHKHHPPLHIKTLKPQQPCTNSKHPFHFSSYFDDDDGDGDDDDEIVSVVYPSVAYSNTLFFGHPYNVHIDVSDDEPEESVLSRFRTAVWRAGIIQECKRRKFFENTREKVKSKAREASRSKRYRRRRLQPKASSQHEGEAPKGHLQPKASSQHEGEAPKGRPQPKASSQHEGEAPKGYEYYFRDDNWDVDDNLEVPYC